MGSARQRRLTYSVAYCTAYDHIRQAFLNLQTAMNRHRYSCSAPRFVAVPPYSTVKLNLVKLSPRKNDSAFYTAELSDSEYISNMAFGDHNYAKR